MRKYVPLLLIVIMLVASALAYDNLPDRMPSHWNERGEIDGYSSRAFGAFGIPVIALFMWGLMRLLPSIDPRRENYDKFRRMYDVLIAGVIGFLALLHLGILGFSLGMPIAVDKLAFGAVGLLFILLGNFLPQARPNWFVGIRTPWTLSSDRVWERTHRVGGYAFALAGLVMLGALAFAPNYVFHTVVGLTVAMAAFVLGYSYFAWRQERGR